MQTELPPTHIWDFYVVSLRVEVVDGYPTLVADKPRPINTYMIDAEVDRPGTFIVGWRECVYTTKYRNNGSPYASDDITGMYKHMENQIRIDKLRRLWEAASKQQISKLSPNNTAVPEVISLEQELKKHSIPYRIEPNGVGTVYDDDERVKLFWDKADGVTEHFWEGLDKDYQSEPETNPLAEHTENSTTPSDNARVDELYLEVADLKGGFNSLNSKMDQILNALSNRT
jgi:hypothetical protein